MQGEPKFVYTIKANGKIVRSKRETQKTSKDKTLKKCGIGIQDRVLSRYNTGKKS